MKMDKKHIIENNILEQYLLGNLSPEDSVQLKAILQSDLIN